MKTYIISFETPTGTQLVEIVAESLDAAVSLAGSQLRETHTSATVVKEQKPDVARAMAGDMLAPSLSLIACLLAATVAMSALRHHFKL